MKVLIFQGQSQYDVLRESSRRTASAFRQLGHEVYIFDMQVWQSKDYLNIIHISNPILLSAATQNVMFFEDKLHAL